MNTDYFIISYSVGWTNPEDTTIYTIFMGHFMTKQSSRQPKISPPVISLSISVDLLIHHSHQRNRNLVDYYTISLILILMMQSCQKFAHAMNWHGMCQILTWLHHYFHIRETYIHTRFKLWAHESFVKLVPEISPPLVSVSISLDLLIHHTHQRDRKLVEAYLTKLKTTHRIS